MSKELEKKIENFINKQEKLVGVEELNKMLASSLFNQPIKITNESLQDLIKDNFLLLEKKFSFKEFLQTNKAKDIPYYYSVMLADFAINQKEIIAFIPNEQKVIIKKEFGQKLADAIKNKKVEEFLVKNSSIPTIDGKNIKLTDIDKSTFTGKGKLASGQEDSVFGNTDVKEGLVCYFLMLLKNNNSKSQLQAAYNKFINQENYEDILQIPLPNQLEKYGVSSKVADAVKIINERPVSDKSKKAFFNAYTSAMAIFPKLHNNKYIVERQGGKVYDLIRSKAATLLVGDSQAVDKWNPSDVYVYNNFAHIQKVLKDFQASNSFVNLGEQEGLNNIFNEQIENHAYGFSLKDASSQHGKIKSIIHFGLKSNNLHSKKLKFSIEPESNEIINNILTNKYLPSVDKIREVHQKYSKQKAFCLVLLQDYNITKIEHEPSYDGKSNPDAIFPLPSFSKDEANDKKYLNFNLDLFTKKYECYRFLNYFLNEFDAVKDINESLKEYDNPLLALTAFGIGKGGYNPTFYKVVGSDIGEEVEAVRFDGQEKLSLVSDYETQKGTNEKKEIELTIDEGEKYGGFKLSFIVSMGKTKEGKDKLYQTTVVARFKGGPDLNVEVYEFGHKK